MITNNLYFWINYTQFSYELELPYRLMVGDVIHINTISKLGVLKSPISISEEEFKCDNDKMLIVDEVYIQDDGNISFTLKTL